MPAKPDDDDEKGAIARASERVKIAATSAVADALHPDNVKSAFAFKLMVIGLTLIALAAGFDYFSHDDEIHKVVSGFAREAEYDTVADWIDWWDLKVDDIKAATLAHLPQTLRDHLAGAALATGAILLFMGVRMKIREHHPVHGNVLRDVGRAIAGPGFVGVFAFTALSYHGALIVRRSFANLYHRIGSGETTWSEAFSLVPHYAGWAYEDVGAILWLGIVLGVGAVGAKIAEPRTERFRIPLEVARRTASWTSALSLVYYASAVFVASVSYGGALPVVTWPWKVDPAAFLAALVFMSFGMGLDRTGTRMIKREDAAAKEDEKAKKKTKKDSAKATKKKS